VLDHDMFGQASEELRPFLKTQAHNAGAVGRGHLQPVAAGFQVDKQAGSVPR